MRERCGKTTREDGGADCREKSILHRGAYAYKVADVTLPDCMQPVCQLRDCHAVFIPDAYEK